MELRLEDGARANRVNAGATEKSKVSGRVNFNISGLSTERT